MNLQCNRIDFMRLYTAIVIVAFLILPANARTGSGLTDNQAAHLCAGAYIDEALTSRGLGMVADWINGSRVITGQRIYRWFWI